MPNIFNNLPWDKITREKMIADLQAKISEECSAYLQNDILGLTQAQAKLNVENKIRESVTRWQDDVLSKYRFLDRQLVRGVGFEFWFSTFEPDTANIGLTDGARDFIIGSKR